MTHTLKTFLLFFLLACAGATDAQTCSLTAAASPTTLAQDGTVNLSWLGFGCAPFTGYTVDIVPDPLELSPILTGNVPGNQIETSWVVPSCLPPGSYYFHINQGTQGGATGVNTNSVTINAGSAPCVYWAKAGSGCGGINPTQVGQGGTLPITWSSQNQSRYKLYLLDWDTGAPFPMDQWVTPPPGETGSGYFAGGQGGAQSGTFTAYAALSPHPSVPPDRYKVRVTAVNSAGLSLYRDTCFFDVTPTLAVGDVAITPANPQSGSTATISWGQRNQVKYQIFVDGASVLGPTTSGASSVPWTVPASMAPGSHNLTVKIWDAANHTATSAALPFTVRRATVAFVAATSTVREPDGSITIPVRLTTSDGNPTSFPVDVAYATANGTATAGLDYQATQGTLHFNASSASGSSQNIVVQILNDVTDDPPETFSVTLGATTGGVVGNPATNTVTIVPAPTAGVSISHCGGVRDGGVGLTVDVWNNSAVNAISSAQVSAAFPGSPACTWTCAASGGSTCSAGPVSGALSDSVALGPSGRLRYEVGCLGATAGQASATVTPNGFAGVSAFDTLALGAYVKGDLNGDHRTDLLLRNGTSWSHELWRMVSVARAGVPLSISPTPGPTQVLKGVDDFNGDARNDLVLWDDTSGNVEFWLMNGVVRTGAAVPLSGAPALSLDWNLSATGDFNADGKPDILWRNDVTQELVIWTMNGTAKLGELVPSPDHAVDPNWVTVAALDFSGDGIRDLLWYNVSSGKIVTWYMNASVVRISGQFTNPPNAGDNNWAVLAGGDYGVGGSGAGVACTNDIVWRNATSGKLVVWHMDNASNRTYGSFTAPDAPPPPATGWTIVGPR